MKDEESDKAFARMQEEIDNLCKRTLRFLIGESNVTVVVALTKIIRMLAYDQPNPSLVILHAIRELARNFEDDHS